MSSNVRSLNHVAIGVRDLEASLAFYTEGLGMRKTLEKPVNDLVGLLLRLPEGTTGQSVFVQGDSRVGQIELVQWDLPRNDNDQPKRPGDFGIGQLSFPVDSDGIQELYERLVDMGVDCYTAPFTTIIKNYGPVTLFVCEDPDGNQVEIMSLPSEAEVRAFRAAHAEVTLEPK